jgi:transcription termination factor Rho
MKNYEFSKAQLCQIGIYELRTLARDCGVRSPTSKKKDALIAEIIAIQSGELDPVEYRKTRRGRPVMYGPLTGDKANYEIGRMYPEMEFKRHFLSEQGGGLILDYAEPTVERRDGACAGVLDIQPEGYGVLRAYNYESGSGDIYVSPQQISEFKLRQGDHIAGLQRGRDGRAYSELCVPERVNGVNPSDTAGRGFFDTLTPIYPTERYTLEQKSVAQPGAQAQSVAVPQPGIQPQSPPQQPPQPGIQPHRQSNSNASLRQIDLLSPIGKGQRALIAAPSGAGKTTLLKNIAKSISLNNPEAHLMTLSLDARPEEAADLIRSLKGEVIYSTFDRSPERHIKTAELVLSRAKRLVELGRDVVLLLDCLTALCRAYNSAAEPWGRGGDAVPGGAQLGGAVDPSALAAKRFFGAARNVEGGGSLTIIAAVIVGGITEDILFEQFKQAANAIITLSANDGVAEFPAIDIGKSGTRNDELLRNL